MRGVPADKSAAMMAPKQKVEKPMRIMGRLFGYILRRYKLHCLGVLLFIFGSTAATVAGNLFMKTLIDDYIVPYIGEGGASDFGPLLAALLLPPLRRRPSLTWFWPASTPLPRSRSSRLSVRSPAWAWLRPRAWSRALPRP